MPWNPFKLSSTNSFSILLHPPQRHSLQTIYNWCTNLCFPCFAREQRFQTEIPNTTIWKVEYVGSTLTYQLWHTNESFRCFINVFINAKKGVSIDLQRRSLSSTPSLSSKEFTLWVVKITVPLDSSSLQYKKKCLGDFPDGMPEDLSGCKLSQILKGKNFIK